MLVVIAVDLAFKMLAIFDIVRIPYVYLSETLVDDLPSAINLAVITTIATEISPQGEGSATAISARIVESARAVPGKKRISST